VTEMIKMNLSDAYWFQEGPGIRNWQFTHEGVKLLNVGNIEKNGNINLAKQIGIFPKTRQTESTNIFSAMKVT